jgi:hypothetical protein
MVQGSYLTIVGLRPTPHEERPRLLASVPLHAVSRLRDYL